MHNYVRVILSAITGLLICNHSIAADATLSLKSTNDYVFVKNIRYPIEGRGMGTSGGYNIIRGEDVSFLTEGFCELGMFADDLSGGGSTQYAYDNVGNYIAEIGDLAWVLSYLNSWNDLIVNDAKYYLSSKSRFFCMCDGGVPSAPLAIVSSTNASFSSTYMLDYIYENSNYGNEWNVSEEIDNMFLHRISESSYQYKYIMKKSNIQNTYRILKELQDLYIHRKTDLEYILNASTGYANGSINSSDTLSGEIYDKRNTYNYEYEKNERNEITGVSWTNTNTTVTNDFFTIGRYNLIEYTYGEEKSHACIVWYKHTSDREDEDEYGNVTTTKLYTAELSYGGLNTLEEQDKVIRSLSPNKLIIPFSGENWFETNRTPFTALSPPVSDVKISLAFQASPTFYYSEMVTNNNISVQSKNLSRRYLIVEQLSNPQFVIAKYSSSSKYNNIYIVIPDSVYISAAEKLISYIKKDLYKSPDAPPRPSISLKSSNVEYHEVRSSYEWSQPSLKTDNMISISVSVPSIVAYSFKPKYRVTFEE